MESNTSETYISVQNESQMSPRSESKADACKEVVRARNENPRKLAKGFPKRCLTLERPVTSKINPKYSKTRLPFPNTKPAPAKLPRPIRRSSSPAKTTDNKKKSSRSSENVPSIAERNKLKIFNIAKEKLREMQSDFLQKSVNLREIKGLQLKGHYKYVGLVLNENNKLIVSDDDLLCLPKNMAPESISDFKERIKICIDSGLNVLYEHLKDIKMSKNEAERRHQVDRTRELLARDQESKLNALLKQVDLICKDSKDNADSDLTNALRDLQETRRSCKQLERKLLDLKKQNAEEQFQLDCTHKTALEEAAKERENMERTFLKLINDYKVNYDKRSSTVGDKECAIEKRNQDIKKLKSQILELNTGMKELTERLGEVEENLTSSKEYIKYKIDVIKALGTQLHQARVHIFKLQAIPALRNFSYEDKDHVIVELQMQASKLKAAHTDLATIVHRRLETQQEIDELKDDHDRVMGEYERLKKELEDRKAKLASNTGNDNEDDLKEEILKSKQEIATLKRELSNSVSGDAAGAQYK